jgi:hypothetical protein
MKSILRTTSLQHHEDAYRIDHRSSLSGLLTTAAKDNMFVVFAGPSNSGDYADTHLHRSDLADTLFPLLRTRWDGFTASFGTAPNGKLAKS